MLGENGINLEIIKYSAYIIKERLKNFYAAQTI